MIVILVALIIVATIIGGSFWLLKGDRRKFRPVAFGAIVLVILVAGGYSSKKHPVYEESIQLLSQDFRIIEIIGSPVSTGFSMKATYDDTFGNFKYSISGPKGKGEVSVYAEKVGNTWEYKTFKVSVSGRVINLLKLPNQTLKRTG